ncbi:MAG: hypothetical protein J0H73_16850 [Salana multivorans]|uniref:hypothetical protein n=1 Tax=Salana multivorans TaxID=120377 RepID=UPI000A5FC310|nr:hypothetical protein [Salana multivorans]MBN8883962.1 hypothetical protein [Salana multivorans]
MTTEPPTPAESPAPTESESTTPEPTGFPSAETIASIDARAAAWREHLDDVELQAALWREVFALEHWFFVPRGTPEAPQPLMLTLSEGPAILAFTSPDRARAAAQGLGLPAEATDQVISVQLPDAIEWVAGLAQHGVRVAVFDYGVQGYLAQLGNLVPIRDWLAARG